MSHSKRNLTAELFFKEAFKQVLKGKIIGDGHSGKKVILKFRIKKEKLTPELMEHADNLIFKKGVMGYHYDYDMGFRGGLLMKVPQKELNKLKEVLIEKDFPVCR